MLKKFLLVAVAAAVCFALCGDAFAADAPKIMDFKRLQAEGNERNAKMYEAMKDVEDAFGEVSKASMKDGPVPHKIKRLIAIAVSLQSHCEGCIMAHVKNAVKEGITRDEIVDMLGVCVVMGGGPSSSYAGIVLEAYDQFTEMAKADAAK